MFIRVWKLITSPAKTWREISEEEDSEGVLQNFVYPLIGLCALAEFAGVFIDNGWSKEWLQLALSKSAGTAIAAFGSFFLSVFLIDNCSAYLAATRFTQSHLQRFVGYSMVVVLLLGIVRFVFDNFILHWVLALYTFNIVFEGLKTFLKVSENKLLVMMVFVSLVIILSPVLIGYVFNLLSVK